ncbi:HTH-type transcriptional repressor FabR [Aliiglaciecola sp. CAU 1673]|uniref:HTH-type transcriptional repressor FabR n=1 Tax=Aliiglaciecola sp. CAU 1673 TaxID=3032595 RepID=UPI0023DA9679|nr:HTH-type transcriptional repressor FabR [Aliiglaciecola sp. CAU 1673]MDF2180337.1 HTH-type transcriptional repressor FabR [Aliiglaciecola sp. CAU 1673]
MRRQEQKQKTRRAIIDAAFSLLDEQRSLSNLSLREVARVAGIAPTSFYRHFKDIDELGLTLVDEAGLALRQLMRQARSRIDAGGSVIKTSVNTFMEFAVENSNEIRLLLREYSGISPAFRAAVSREIQHFTQELSDYTASHTGLSRQLANLQAEAMVRLVFSAGAEAIDATQVQRELLGQRLIQQLKFIAKGAVHYGGSNR